MALKKIVKPKVLKPTVLKPKLQAPLRKPKVSPLSYVTNTGYTGQYRGNFPFKPEMKDWEIVTSLQRLRMLASRLNKVDAFAFDTETNTLRVLGPCKEFKCVGISISWGEDHNYYIPIGHVRDEDLDRQLTVDQVVKYLSKPFGRTDVVIVGHNLKFDMHVMKRIGIDINTKMLFDTMLASWLCDENTPNGLKENSGEKMGLDQTHFKEVTDGVPNEIRKRFGYKANSKVPFDLVLIDDGAPYALADSFYTWCLYLGFTKELEDEQMDKIYYKVNIPFLLTLFKMEERGVTVDIPKLEQMAVDMQEDLDDLQYRIYEYSGVEFNIGSSQQKAEILFGYIKPPKKVDMKKAPAKIRKLFDERDFRALEQEGYYRQSDGMYKESNYNQHIVDCSFDFKPQGATKSGAPSTDNNAIWKLSKQSFKKNKRKQEGVEMCKLLMEYAKLSKLKTAFVDGLLEQLYDDGKVHPSFNQIGTDSGRISCSKPNLQQLPKAEDDDKYQIRSLFIGSINPATGKRNKIIALDYKNLEMMCLTHFSKDENLLRMFRENEDAHGSTACNMFDLPCSTEEVKKQYPHLRQAAKIINFMLMYGGGAKALYEALKEDHYNPIDLGDKEYLKQYNCKNGVEVAQVYIDKYFDSYKGVAKFIQGQRKYAHKNKYVYTILGRKRRLPDINSSDTFTRAYCERLSVNSAIQGTAGDITISAQNRVDADDYLLNELGAKMIIQVHDELVLECPEENCEEAIKRIVEYMEDPFNGKPLNIQLVADYDIGDSYQEAK